VLNSIFLVIYAFFSPLDGLPNVHSEDDRAAKAQIVAALLGVTAWIVGWLLYLLGVF
jgi:hypothetical protein